MNIANVLNASAERDPKKAAIVLKNESISHEQLDRSTTSLARWFLRQGLKLEDRVALFFASFKAGMIGMPINVRMKTPEVTYILEHSNAAMYFAHPDLLAVAEEARSDCGQLDVIQTTLGTASNL
jgi:acyl-CoA synthetase (AMP-forming)/AMP-acid ligase II